MIPQRFKFLLILFLSRKRMNNKIYTISEHTSSA